jgi:EAL domain-containing protein (putative c-di-GMP-specific phosphodiesterase class I)/GGDEF domain-containing protein
VVLSLAWNNPWRQDPLGWVVFLRLGCAALFAVCLVIALRLPSPSPVLGRLAIGTTAGNYLATLVVLLYSRGDLILSQVSYLFISLGFLLLFGFFARSRRPVLLFGALAVVLDIVVFTFLPRDTFGSPMSRDEMATALGQADLILLPVYVFLVVLITDKSAALLGQARAATERLSRIAFLDSDTGLPNGPALEKDLEAWGRGNLEPGTHLVLAAFRLEGLDALNAIRGLDFTTQTVKRVTHRWLAEWEERMERSPQFRKPVGLQTCYRIEGSTILFPATQPADGSSDRLEVRTRLGAILREEHLLDTRLPALGFHGGFARYPADGDSPSRLVRNLLNLLHSGPDHARGDFVPLNPGDYARFVRREGLRAALAAALEGPQFGVVFQPKVRLTDGEVVGFEALARWTSPDLGAVGPDEFIPVAERYGLVAALTRRVCRDALDFVEHLANAGAAVSRVSVNLSPSLLDVRFLDELAADQRLVRWASWVELEITEGGAMVLPPPVRERFQALRALGITFSIDDFGTGYSNLTTLQELDAQVLKVDKRFIDGIPGNAQNVSLVAAVLSMAQVFGMEVVAEGVETRQQFDFLLKVGCDQIQGYFASRPLDAAGAAAFRFSPPPGS